MIIRNEASVHMRLAEGPRPDNPMMAWQWRDFDFSAASHDIAELNREITQQALMVSYVDSYWVIFLACLAVAPLIIMVKRPRKPSADAPPIVMGE